MTFLDYYEEMPGTIYKDLIMKYRAELLLVLICFLVTGLFSDDPFGDPVILPGFMFVYGIVTQDGLPASGSDVIAVFVDEQLRGKSGLTQIEETTWVSLYVNTEFSNELLSFFLWDSSADSIIIVQTDEPIMSSPGSSNSPDDPVYFHADRVDQPFFITEPGSYDNCVYVELGTDDLDATIRYTIDGSYPDNYAYEYTDPVYLDLTSTLTAIACKPGWTQSNPVSGEFIIHYPGIIYGDVDRNGLVQAADASAILQYSVGLDPIPDIDPVPWGGESFTIADVDGNMLIQALDASLVLRYSVGLIDQFPVERNFAYKLTETKLLAELINDQIVFIGSGDILGLNVKYEIQCFLGNPHDFHQDYIYAQNRIGNLKKIGLAGIVTCLEPQVLFKLPVECSNTLQTFDVMYQINDQEFRELTIDFLNIEKHFEDLDFEKNKLSLSAYPNPSNFNTIVSLKLENCTYDLDFSIYNIEGRLVQNIHSGALTEGLHYFNWDGKNIYGRTVSSGIYFATAKISGYSASVKLIILK